MRIMYCTHIGLVSYKISFSIKSMTITAVGANSSRNISYSRVDTAEAQRREQHHYNAKRTQAAITTVLRCVILTENKSRKLP
jgi:hypothetical protein